jgi:hypothetical protein
LKKENGELGEDVIKINERNFSIGERIMFLENNRKYGIKNGQFAVITDVSKNDIKHQESFLHLQLENGKNAAIDTSEYDKIDHSYAMTLHKSQGKTIDNVIVIADKMMDASATYVAMTRHKKDIAMFYKTSDFQNFKSLADNLSKYRHKDSIIDYRMQDNSNKTRVYEYKNNLMEMAETLREIHTGKQDWKKYHELKNANTELGREIAQDYDSHKLYLNQIGITKEKLEMSVGLRQRPLTNVEMNAKNTVELYAKSSQESRELFQKMRNENFNITKHSRYIEYTQLREIRNDLANEILANYPLYREFVNQVSREYFVSKKGMENQIAYAEQMKGKSNSAEINFFQKLEKARRNFKFTYKGSTVADRIVLDKNAYAHDERYADYIKKFGCAPSVTKSMMFAYCGENNVANTIHSGTVAHEYASIIAREKMAKAGMQKINLETAEDSIKQALCFRALQNSLGIKELTLEHVEKLHAQAALLKNYITKENVHVLNNENFVKEAEKYVHDKVEGAESISQTYIQRIVEVAKSDMIKAELSKTRELENSTKIEKSYEMSL